MPPAAKGVSKGSDAGSGEGFEGHSSLSVERVREVSRFMIIPREFEYYRVQAISKFQIVPSTCGPSLPARHDRDPVNVTRHAPPKVAHPIRADDRPPPLGLGRGEPR